ncbi:hypothetical protein AB1Y20_019088 [Prymnesium parvum]|uniref:Apple domain-containing protein n=1 Tax=Prymnesium parvum TaxID=97485 RepID=A0AB34JRH4_PRYPA
MRLPLLLCAVCSLALAFNLLRAWNATQTRRPALTEYSAHSRAALGVTTPSLRASQRAASPPTIVPPAASPRAAVPETAAATPPPYPETVGASLSNYSGTPHVELWGALVLPGDANLQPDAPRCHQSCVEYEPTRDVLNGSQCNVWVWHPLTQQCWLKHERPAELRAAASALARPGRASVAWTSGVWTGHKPCADCVVPARYYGCITKDICNTSRACGSPAIDGYAHVDPKCVQRSPTAQLYNELLANGSELIGTHELNADYDGLGVHWGIGHTKQRWEDCEQACRQHRPGTGGGPFAALPCNVWTWCSRPTCFEPDAHSHHFGDCWLKFTELPHAPEVNMREPMRSSFMRRHHTQMAAGVPWVSGALLPPGVTMTNGTWGPRAFW